MNIKIQTLLQSANTKNVRLGVAAFCSGFGLGVYLGQRNQAVVIEPDVTLATELTEVVQEYAETPLITVFADTHDIVIDPPHNDPSMIMVDRDKVFHRDALIEAFGFTEGMRMYQEEYSMGTETLSSDDEELEESEEVVSIFSKNNDDWNQEEEESARTNQEPYVLHKDEFWREEYGYDQLTLTYYAGDDILVDQEETPIYNHNSLMGPLTFGHGSNDQNVVYIRNDKLKAEYEILRDRGHYAIEVLGLEAEEKHDKASFKHSFTKFRPDD